LGALLGPRDDACGDWAAGKEDGQEFDAASHGGAAALVSAHARGRRASPINRRLCLGGGGVMTNAHVGHRSQGMGR
jgi:hypothetical protein